jgi:hypothetical protein
MVRTALAATIVIVAAATACGSKQNAKSPPPEPDRPIAGIADLVGDWKATDTDGWTYQLAIAGDGAYSQTIDRGADQKTCVQKGKLQGFKEVWGQDYDPRNFGYGGGGYGGASYGGGGTVLALVLTIEDNKCNPDYTGAQLITLASNFTGGSIVLRTGQPGGAQETHQYYRVVTATGR